MLREIKYIWYGMTYSELRTLLRESRKLRGFPLVDNPAHMVLLGSIQRTELIAAIERHIGHERRMEVRARNRGANFLPSLKASLFVGRSHALRGRTPSSSRT